MMKLCAANVLDHTCYEHTYIYWAKSAVSSYRLCFLLLLLVYKDATATAIHPASQPASRVKVTR